jgi:hypothetical protein
MPWDHRPPSRLQNPSLHHTRSMPRHQSLSPARFRLPVKRTTSVSV